MDTRHVDDVIFKRLAQDFESIATELRQFAQEEINAPWRDEDFVDDTS